jgi:hypothetical protein
LHEYRRKQEIDDALIQPYSGHASRKSLVYSILAITDAQDEYERVISETNDLSSLIGISSHFSISWANGGKIDGCSPYHKKKK